MKIKGQLPSVCEEPASEQTEIVGMSTTIARQRMPLNVASSLAAIIFSMGISLVITPYLISRLGVAAYGMVGLANSFPGYILLTTQSLSNSLFRHISIEAHQGRLENANLYFNTAFKAALGISALLLLPVGMISLFSTEIFEVPLEVQRQTSWLIFLVLLASLVSVIATPFGVAYPLTHRFFLQNLLKIVGQLAGLAVLVGCFWLLRASLVYVGLYQLVFAGVTGFLIYFFQQRFQVVFRLQRKRFSWPALREMYHMAGFLLINDLAALLFTSAGLIIVNKTLGAEACGQLAPIMLIVNLHMLLGMSISNVIMPVIYEYVSRGDLRQLSILTLRNIRLTACLLGVPVILICGFAAQLLELWIGGGFVFLWPIVCIVILSLHFGGIVFLPYTHVYRGMNRVRFPALMNIGFAVGNVVLMYELLTRTSLGLWAFGISYGIAFGLRGIGMNGLYCDYLLRIPFGSSWANLSRFAVFAILAIYGTHCLSLHFHSFAATCLGIIGASGFCLVVSLLLLSREDRHFLLSLWRTKLTRCATT